MNIRIPYTRAIATCSTLASALLLAACAHFSQDGGFDAVAQAAAPRIGQTEITLDGVTHDTRMLTTRLVRGFNVLGFPALSIPCGASPDGLPIGLQLAARPFEENLLLMLGEALN